MPGEAELRLCLGDLGRSSEAREATDSAVLGGLGVSFRLVSLLDLGENMSFLMMGNGSLSFFLQFSGLPRLPVWCPRRDLFRQDSLVLGGADSRWYKYRIRTLRSRQIQGLIYRAK